MIDVYNDGKPTELRYLARLIGNRVRMQGFIVSDFMDRAERVLPRHGRAAGSGAAAGARRRCMKGSTRCPTRFWGCSAAATRARCWCGCNEPRGATERRSRPPAHRTDPEAFCMTLRVQADAAPVHGIWQPFVAICGVHRCTAGQPDPLLRRRYRLSGRALRCDIRSSATILYRSSGRQRRRSPPCLRFPDGEFIDRRLFCFSTSN